MFGRTTFPCCLFIILCPSFLFFFCCFLDLSGHPLLHRMTTLLLSPTSTTFATKRPRAYAGVPATTSCSFSVFCRRQDALDHNMSLPPPSSLPSLSSTSAPPPCRSSPALPSLAMTASTLRLWPRQKGLGPRRGKRSKGMLFSVPCTSLACESTRKELRVRNNLVFHHLVKNAPDCCRSCSRIPTKQALTKTSNFDCLPAWRWSSRHPRWSRWEFCLSWEAQCVQISM